VAAVQAVAGADGAPVLVVTHGAAIGVVERHLDVHPGTPVPKLSGRWFEFDGSLRVASDRLELISD
jgi:hypothetical protein